MQSTRITGGWHTAQRNPLYRAGSLSDAEGRAIHWHSPDSPHSSQIFCISAFGSLRGLPDRDRILAQLFAGILPRGAACGPWHVQPEFHDPSRLGETSAGQPSVIDVFCHSADAAVCLEAKFLTDARHGFGGCSQCGRGYCAGYYGVGSDLKTGTDAHCRLAIGDGKRTPRRYWEAGRQYFRAAVYTSQRSGETCPFAGPNFQLMRNFLFAAKSGLPHFGLLVIVPRTLMASCAEQLEIFHTTILRPEHQSRVALVTYETVISYLRESACDASRQLGDFLRTGLHETIHKDSCSRKGE